MRGWVDQGWVRKCPAASEGHHGYLRNHPGRAPVVRATFYFLSGSCTGTWGDVVLTLTLPSGYWRLFLTRASRIRMNFSASMMHLGNSSASRTSTALLRS